MADAGTKDFGSILSDGLYRIPTYQRGYAWTNEEVNALLDDLQYVTDNSAVEEHYLNSIIVTETGEDDGVEADAVHIIDGQQRLVTANLLANEILRRTLEIASPTDEDHEYHRRQVERRLDKVVVRSHGDWKERRLLPAEEHQEVFKKLVPEEFDAERDLKEVEEMASSPSEEKLVEAVFTIRRRLDSFLDARESARDQLNYLGRLAETLHDDFTATLHEVENPSEAGRIFEAINDRGRDLNRADKIKSYLVYRASLGDISMDIREIHGTFTYVYERLNKYAATPSRVDDLADRLISKHWILFANEDTINREADLVGRHEEASGDLDQIKHAAYHVPKQADDSRLDDWLSGYLNSLEEAVDAYVHVRGSKQRSLYEQEGELRDFLSDDVDPDKVRQSLYAIETFGPSTTHSLSMAAYIRFGNTPHYEKIVEALEAFTIRVFGVGGARRDNRRTSLNNLARVLFWQGREDLTDVFPPDSRIPKAVKDDAEKYGIQGNHDDATKVIDRLTDWAYRDSHKTRDGEEIDIFQERLFEDNLDGLAVAGWGGLSSSELKNYNLYEYERAIREGGASIRNYLDAGIYDYTVEHVWPDTRGDKDIAPELDDDEYARQVDRIGSLAFLTLSENASAGNQDYKIKYRETYSTAGDGTKMLREEFPDPDDPSSSIAAEAGFETWGVDLIEWRSGRMAAKLASHWNVST